MSHHDAQHGRNMPGITLRFLRHSVDACCSLRADGAGPAAQTAAASPGRRRGGAIAAASSPPFAGSEGGLRQQAVLQ